MASDGFDCIAGMHFWSLGLLSLPTTSWSGDDISFVRTTETGLDGCRHETFCDTLGRIGVLNWNRETVRMVIFI